MEGLSAKRSLWVERCAEGVHGVSECKRSLHGGVHREGVRRV